MGRYLDLAKQVPLRSADPVPDPVPAKNFVSSDVSPSKHEQRESLDRLISQGAGYIQITSRAEEIYIALTESVYHDLSQRSDVTVYHAAHLIELSDNEIRLIQSLRTIGGPGGSMKVQG